MAEVRKTWSSQTIGELQPRPGTSTFQTTFWVSLQESGRPGSSATTPAFGPRNCGHWSAAEIVASARSVSAAVVTSLRIGYPPELERGSGLVFQHCLAC